MAAVIRGTATARPRRLPSDLGPRVAVAVPGAVVFLALTLAGGWPFALVLATLGALGQAELARMLRVPRPAALAGAAGVAAAPVAAMAGGRPALAVAAGAAAAGGVLVAAWLAAPDHRRTTAAVTAGGVLWLGVALGHAVLLRELDHGAALVVAVLLATFVGDTAAHLAGTAYGRRRIAPSISPNKTLEGLLAGLVVGIATAWAFLVLGRTWIGTGEALAIAAAAAVAAPCGDLLESGLKRRAGVKDSGRVFGAHGGVLDRIDAVIVAALAGYHAALAVT